MNDRFAIVPYDAAVRLHTLSAAAAGLYAVLCLCRDRQSGRCNPKIKQLREMLEGMPERTFFRAKQELIHAVWVKETPDGFDLLQGFTAKNGSELLPKMAVETAKNGSELLPKMAVETAKNGSELLPKMAVETAKNGSPIRKSDHEQTNTTDHEQTERESVRETVSTIYEANYGHPPPIYGLERLAEVTDLELWREVMVAWKANAWRLNNFDAMAREYKARAERKTKDGKPGTHQINTANGQQQSSPIGNFGRNARRIGGKPSGGKP